MNKTHFALGALTLAAATALTACGGGDSEPKSVTIEFAAVAGTTPIDCSSNLADLGTTKATGTVKVSSATFRSLG